MTQAWRRRISRAAMAAALTLLPLWDTLAAAQTPPKPVTRAPASRSDARDAARDVKKDPSHPGFDPNHPLKDPTKDPGPGGNTATDGSPAILTTKGNWPWGELVYGKTYPSTLTIRNECWSDETVGIFVTNLPYISLPATITIPAKSSRDIPINIVTPPPPNLILTGHETLPEHGIWGEIEGEVVIWHPWRFDPECMPNRESYKATGHIHYDATPPPAPPSPEKIAGASPCQVWWNTGQRPPQVKDDAQCVDDIRKLASDYRARVLQTHQDRAPAAWAWLPPAGQFAQMSIADCLRMKARAQAQLEKQR